MCGGDMGGPAQRNQHTTWGRKKRKLKAEEGREAVSQGDADPELQSAEPESRPNRSQRRPGRLEVSCRRHRSLARLLHPAGSSAPSPYRLNMMLDT
ncbi:hypothetical protein AOLI_G00073490 [Acnodon oligacanthus]